MLPRGHMTGSYQEKRNAVGKGGYDSKSSMLHPANDYDRVLKLRIISWYTSNHHASSSLPAKGGIIFNPILYVYFSTRRLQAVRNFISNLGLKLFTRASQPWKFRCVNLILFVPRGLVFCCGVE